ncbi:MAG: hypothetical protein QF872_04445 [Gammaproteobacteria bacterium]|nr:hypothetical protein [Gammaproteobacteria bacterium]
MLDPKLIRNDAEQIAEQLRIKGYELDVARLSALENQRKQLQIDTESLQGERNAKSKQIGQLKSQGLAVDKILAEVGSLGAKLDASKNQLKALQTELDGILSGVPNIPHASVPAGADEDDNVQVASWGEKPEFDFPIRDHVDLGEGLGGLNFAAATKLAGARFMVLEGPLARLHRALIQFMLNTLIKHYLKIMTD